MTPIKFNSGFNVIFGDVEDKQGERNEHNLGKTSLVHLVDFLLLKTTTKKHFLSKHKKRFSGWVFYIEIELEEKYFITIRRSVDTPTLISFKRHTIADQDFSSSDNWDYKNIKLHAKKEKDAVTIFEEYLNFDVLQQYSVRHFLTYLLRTQYDYEDVFKMRQFAGRDIDWKPQLFNLLGYRDEEVINKYRKQDELDIYKKLLKTIVGNRKNHAGESYNLKAAIAEQEKEKKIIQDQINKFDFYLREKKLNKKLIEETESKISKLNSERYRLDYEIKRIQDALESNVTFDLNEIKEVFEQFKIFFPNELRKSYQDLIDFNTSLSKERSKYLKEDLQTNIGELEKVSTELKQMNSEKENVLAFLRDTDTFSKYKGFQNNLFKIEEQITQFKVKLESLSNAENYQKRIDALKTESKEVAEKIKNVIDNGSEIFESVNRIFKEIFKKTMDHTALLVVKPNQEGNPDFEPITLDDKDEDQLTGQGEGYTATKVQCAAFILAILATYEKRRFFEFAYFDGLVESWGDRPKTNFFNEINAFCTKHNIQFTISLIKSDVPHNFKFRDGEIISTLNHNKPLFGFSF